MRYAGKYTGEGIVMVGSRKKLLIIPLMALLLVLVMAGTASAGLGAKEAAEMVKTKLKCPWISRSLN